MTIIKVKQSIIDKVGVRCTRRAGNTSGQCHCRTPTWHAYIHDLTSYRLRYCTVHYCVQSRTSRDALVPVGVDVL